MHKLVGNDNFIDLECLSNQNQDRICTKVIILSLNHIVSIFY